MSGMPFTRRSGTELPSTPAVGTAVMFRDAGGVFQVLDSDGNVSPLYEYMGGKSLGQQPADEAEISGGSVRPGTLGYSSESRGSVTQGTSKSTAVTLDNPVGKITTHNATLNAGASVTFTLNCSVIEAEDLLRAEHVSGGTVGAYLIFPRVTGAGTASITITNRTAGNLGEALVLHYMNFKG